MINFRWGQAAGQASGFNLAAAQAISRGLRKDEGWGGGVGGGVVRPCDIAWVHLRNAPKPVFSSVPQLPLPPSLPLPPALPTWLN